MEDNAIEVTYTFPLPPDATVCGFEVITNNKALTGKVAETDDALEQYDAAITSGDGAYLLESHRPDIFTINVGNLDSHQIAIIRIDYVRSIKLVDNVISLAYPTTVATRYVTEIDKSDDFDYGYDGAVINPPQASDVPYGLTLDVLIDDSLNVSSVESGSHVISSVPVINSKDGQSQGSRLSLIEGQVDMDRDVLIDIGLGNDDEPSLRVEPHENGKHYGLLSFMPEFSSLELEDNSLKNSNVVFVIDCSGSMAGRSMTQAKNALQLCLRSLKMGDRFNIVRFGSRFEQFSESLEVYDESSLSAALNYVEGIDANLGGTEMFQPLESVFKSTSGFADVDVVVLTDGQVSNEAAVIDLARNHAATHRLFTFGIGSAASRHLVTGLASATGGMVETIGHDERIEDKVLRTFSRMASPRLSDLSLKTDGDARLVLAAGELPPIFDGDSIAALLEVEGSIGTEWSLTARHGKQDLSWAVPVAANSAEHSDIPILWADQRIKYLQSTLTQYNRQCSGDALSARARSRVETSVVELSEEFGVLCEKTCFIALEHRSVSERNEGMPEQRRVMVNTPYGGHDKYDSDMVNMSMSMAPEIMDIKPKLSAYRTDSTQVSKSRKHRVEIVEADAVYTSPSLDSEVRQLLNLQQAEGWFADNDFESARLAEFTESFESEFDSIGKNIGETTLERIINTLFVLSRLRSEFLAERFLWQRAADKAEEYLIDVGLDKESVAKLIAK